MAYYENGKLSKSEQMKIRAEEQNILQGSGDPTWKAAKIDALYGSYGLQTGSFDEPGHQAQTDSHDSSNSGGLIKFGIIFFVGGYLLLKGCTVFQEHFPVLGDAFKAWLVHALGQ